jgi:UDP-glucose:tetrahydrobiopterin glucosyltransferase
MRIALVAPLVTPIAQPYTGGAQALVAAIAQRLQQQGHRVTLFARAGSFVADVPIELIEVPESVRPSSFDGPPQERPLDPGFFAQANIFFDLFLQLRQRTSEFDLIHAHAFDWPAITFSTLIEAIPVIHTLHLPAVTPEINEALRTLHHQGHPLTLITVSQACAQTYADYTPFDRIIYNGLDLDAIPFSPYVENNAPLLFAGRITPEKGVETAIAIAEQAGVPLLIAGGIYDKAYYEQRIQPRLKRAGQHVTYLGQLAHKDLWQLMGQTQGLLFPIEWDEPFGLAPVEAMAAGTPVIAFKRGAAEEIIAHGITGFLVAPGDKKTAAALVTQLPTLSRRACREHVEQHFSMHTMLNAYLHIYKGLVSKNQ